MSENTQSGDLVDGHIRYAKGAAESAIGDLTGSHPWKDSGEQDMAAGKAALQRAGEQRDKTQGYGKAEEIAGKVTGCEGMKEEGAASQTKSD